MAKKKGKIGDIRGTYKDQNESLDMFIRLQEKELNNLNNIFDINKKLEASQDIQNMQQSKANRMIGGYNELVDKGFSFTKRQIKIFEKELGIQSELNTLAQKNVQIHQKKAILFDQIVKSSTEFLNIMKKSGISVVSYLFEADAAMKNLTLELGLSGDRSAELTKNLSEAAPYTARMGVDMKTLTQMTSVYADETGRVRLLNEENLEAISLMAEGTNLGAEGAARMAGQYEMMGFNATDTAKEVQRIVDTTERMGVNTSKVLKAVNKNFKTLQKYSFRNGVKSMADMAAYAEKFKIDMNSVFEPMEKGRRLDSVIEMSAQLQVLGGQFANLADPLSMLFESRNDPEAYMKRINDMTKGMVTLNKTADGFSFELASPMAKDMLSQAAKALGMTTEELTQQAFRMREIQQTRSQMFNKGLSNSEKEIVEGLAKFSKESGRMFVEIGGVATDVSKLTSNQVKALKTEQSTLEARALASQSFDEAFKNTIMELKATFLPLLKSMNEGLKAIRPIVSSLLDTFKDGNGFVKGGMIMAALLTGAAVKLAFAFTKGKALGFLSSKGLASGINTGGGKAAGGLLGGGISNTSKGAARGSGMLKGGLGVGAAAVGIGAGVGAAAVGISKLADSMSKLTPEQAESLETIATTLAISFPLAAIGVGVLAAVAAPAAIPLLALGGAIFAIGAGVGVAAAGIGYMAEGMSNLDKVDLSKAGEGMLKIGAAGLMLGNPMGLIGMAAMTASVTAIGLNADNMERVGNAFNNIGAVLKGSSAQFKEVRDTIKEIASTDLNNNSSLSNLVNMFSKPLKVEFADKEVGFSANIDLTIGDNSFMTEISKKLPVYQMNLQRGGIG